MSDYEGLEYEARVDEAMDDVLGRDGWCGVCGGWSPADPPMCDLCGVRLCGRCAVEYPDGAFECPECGEVIDFENAAVEEVVFDDEDDEDEKD